MIDDNEPTIQGLYKPSVVIERRGRRIGIIGIILSSTPVGIKHSNTSRLFFFLDIG